ncbi:MAG: serine/threonine protein kinase [Nannocystales bacterium]
MQAEDVTKVVDREPEASGGDPLPPAVSDAVEATSNLERKPDRSPEVGPVRPMDKVAEVEPGRVLVGRYELIHRLGHGGMASVYLGRAIGTAGFERLVAVKVIHPHLANESEFVEMFLDEARIAAKIHHPNVCETLDLGEDDGLFFMVMEYVEGETLSSLIRQLGKRDDSLPVPCALQITADACRGLGAAHALEDTDGTPLNLVHRDVSPHNLLVTMDGRVKVVDFGIMKAAGKRSNTLTGQLRGKLTYMSPEQARGEPVDRRSDIYAMGVILWELLAGARFYRGETESEILAQVSLGRRQDIADYRDDLPPGVVAVLDKALAESRTDRYETADDMLKDLRAALRQLLDADQEDPREALSGVMKGFFASRMRYIQAAIRGQVDDREGSNRKHRAANDSKTGVSRARSLTPSSVAIGRTGTLTSSVVTAPARSWALWLILPLAGAVLGTLAVRALSGSEADSSRPVVREPATVVEPAGPKMVTWWINTDPQGATVTIDGKTLEKTTPTSVQLPASDERIEVKAELAGYKAYVAEMAPLSSENHALRLEPAYKTTFRARSFDGPGGEKPAEPAAPVTPPKKRHKRPKKLRAKPDTAPTSSPPPAAGDTRRPEDVPDFLKRKKPK